MRDLYSGTPRKLKNVDVATLEKEFAEIVDKHVAGKGKTEADIQFIDFHPSDSVTSYTGGHVVMKILFSKEVDTSWMSSGNEETSNET